MEQNEIGVEEAPVMTFDEILEDKEYQREFDRRVTKATETAVTNAKAKWEQEAELKKAEAEKLAKMDADEKKKYELEQANKRALTAESELNAFKLKDEAIRQASAKGVDLEIMNEIDYTKETAESIAKKIETYARVSKKIHEKAIQDYSKESAPQVGDHVDLSKDKKQMSYTELCKLPEYQEK